MNSLSFCEIRMKYIRIAGLLNAREAQLPTSLTCL